MKKINYFLSAAIVMISSLSFAQLSGNFTAGTSASNYPSLTAAISALQSSGVGAGGVTLTIAPGIYQENIVIGAIAGISESSPLIIVAAPGTVTFEGTGTSASTDAVFLINALSFITIDGIEIIDKSAPGMDAEFGIRFLGSTTVGCQNNTVKNCTITMGPNGARPSASSRGIVFLSTAASAAAANNNNTIDNVKIDNSGWGIQFSCAANFFGQIAHPDFNNAVINSTFGSVLPLGHDFSSGALAINALGGRNMLIENNIIAGISNLNSTPAVPVSTSGISLDSSSGIVRGNTISNIEYQGTIGLVFGIRSSTFLGDETLIANNSISNLKRSAFVASTSDPSLTIVGIWIFNQTGNNGLAKVVHNSVFLSSDENVSFSSGGINLAGGSTGQFPAEVFNNIIVNNISTSSASYRSFALADGNTTRGFLQSNNNVLFANGTNGYLGVIGRELGGNEQFSNNLAAFQAFSLTDQNSVNFSPTFTDVTTGDLSIPASAPNSASYLVPNLAIVPLDIEGTTRFIPQTFAGAYESAEPLNINQVSNLELTLYPNPTVDYLNIANISSGTLDYVKIYNTLGAEVINTKFDNTAFQSNYQIDVSGLTTGMYIIEVNGADGSSTRKFVKN